MAIVTVSRTLGSEGDRIAYEAAEQLGYELIDSALIVKVAERAGVTVENAAHFDEQYTPRTVEWLKQIIEPRLDKILAHEEKHLDTDAFVEYATTVIRDLATQGRVVIVGRAGQFVLADVDTAFHVRVVADEEFRTGRVSSRYGLDGNAALEMVRKSDNRRGHYIERYFRRDWNDPTAYHMVINASKVGVEDAVSAIVAAVERFARSHEVIPGVRDRRSGEDRRVKERRQGERRTSDVGYSFKEIEKRVYREGRPLREKSRPDRRRHERRQVLRRKEDRSV